VPLQQVEDPVDVLDQADFPGQQVDRLDAAGCDGPCPAARLVADVRGCRHRLGAFDAGPVFQSAKGSPLASGDLVIDTGVHSNASWQRSADVGQVRRLFAETRGRLSLSNRSGLILRLSELPGLAPGVRVACARGESHGDRTPS
jgi:hypothetical protein